MYIKSRHILTIKQLCFEEAQARKQSRRVLSFHAATETARANLYFSIDRIEAEELLFNTIINGPPLNLSRIEQTIFIEKF